MQGLTLIGETRSSGPSIAVPATRCRRGRVGAGLCHARLSLASERSIADADSRATEACASTSTSLSRCVSFTCLCRPGPRSADKRGCAKAMAADSANSRKPQKSATRSRLPGLATSRSISTITAQGRGLSPCHPAIAYCQGVRAIFRASGRRLRHRRVLQPPTRARHLRFDAFRFIAASDAVRRGARGSAARLVQPVMSGSTLPWVRVRCGSFTPPREGAREHTGGRVLAIGYARRSRKGRSSASCRNVLVSTGIAEFVADLRVAI